MKTEYPRYFRKKNYLSQNDVFIIRNRDELAIFDGEYLEFTREEHFVNWLKCKDYEEITKYEAVLLI